MEILLNENLPKNKAREQAIQYSEERHTNKSVVMAIAGATGRKIDYHSFEEGDGRMCTLFDTIEKESESKGKAEEITETGYEFGMSESDILDRLQKKLDVSLRKAQEYFKIFEHVVQETCQHAGLFCASMTGKSSWMWKAWLPAVSKLSGRGEPSHGRKGSKSP